jgi:hypothetical protein
MPVVERRRLTMSCVRAARPARACYTVGMSPTVVFFVTGASGSEKTACMPELKRLLRGVEVCGRRRGRASAHLGADPELVGGEEQEVQAAVAAVADRVGERQAANHPDGLPRRTDRPRPGRSSRLGGRPAPRIASTIIILGPPDEADGSAARHLEHTVRTRV